MKNFKKICAVIIAVMVVMSSMSTVLGGLVFADAVVDLTISTVDDLVDFANAVNSGDDFKGKTVVLANDIQLMDSEGIPTMTPIGTKENPFMGTFDGQGYTIDNLYMGEYEGEDQDIYANSYVGLFGFTEAVIKNVTVNNPFIVGKSYVGGIVGCAYTGTVENCHVTGEIDIEGYYMVGGITGHGYAKIVDCSVIGDPDWDYSYIGAEYYESDLEGDNVGGIIGHRAELSGVVISGCEVANVEITGTRKVGGIVGCAFQNSTIEDCSVSNVVIETTATADYASTKANSMCIGGIVGVYEKYGSNDGELNGCSVEDITLVDANDAGVSMGYVVGGLRDKSVTTGPVAPTIDANNVVVKGANNGATVDYFAPVAIPSAKVDNIPVKELLTSNAPTLTFAKKFVANEATDETMAAYGDWYADFVLTVNKTVTFNGDGSADGYLAGRYDAWENNKWVTVPFSDVTLEAGQSLKIMEYAAELMGQTGLKITCEEVINLVQEFECGVFFDEEFLAANPELEVNLELKIFNPENEEETYVIHSKETFVPANAIVYPAVPSATVTDLKAKDLPDDTELTFAKKFVADEVTEETAEAYADWFSDFVLVVNKDVTFNANGEADGYLAGQYQEAYGDTWIKVPFEDVTLKANQPVKIMELAAQMLGQSELKITYADILNFVKEFNCGVYFDEDFKAANPDVTVSLELQVFNPVNESESITIHEAKTLTLDDAIIYNPAIGDVNVDGKVDAADIALIRQALLGFVEADEYFNVNGDESFDVRDLVNIKKLVAGFVVTDDDALKSAFAEGGDIDLGADFKVDDGTAIKAAANINGNGNSITRDTGSGNPLMVSTTEPVVITNVVFESTKGNAAIATRTAGANITLKDCVFNNHANPSTGNTGMQVYAENVVITFENCTFNNMPIVTNSSYKKGIKMVFNNCTFNWVGDNCPGVVQLANYVEADLDFNNCKFTYETSSQYTTAKTLISFNTGVGTTTIDFNGLEVVGTRNNENIWKIVSTSKNATVTLTGDASYVFNGEEVDIQNYF